MKHMETDTLNIENILRIIGLLKKNSDNAYKENIVVVHNRDEWLSGFNAIAYKMTRYELDNANDKGFIKSVRGIDCFLTKPINFVLNIKNK